LGQGSGLGKEENTSPIKRGQGSGVRGRAASQLPSVPRLSSLAPGFIRGRRKFVPRQDFLIKSLLYALGYPDPD